jgi:hypothetical protein
MLRGVCDIFTERFGEPDVVEARAVLDQAPRGT